MSAFWQRQLEFVQALVLAVCMCCAAWLMAWASGSADIHGIILGMALFQACLATVRAGK